MLLNNHDVLFSEENRRPTIEELNEIEARCQSRYGTTQGAGGNYEDVVTLLKALGRNVRQY